MSQQANTPRRRGTTRDLSALFTRASRRRLRRWGSTACSVSAVRVVGPCGLPAVWTRSRLSGGHRGNLEGEINNLARKHPTVLHGKGQPLTGIFLLLVCALGVSNDPSIGRDLGVGGREGSLQLGQALLWRLRVERDYTGALATLGASTRAVTASVPGIARSHQNHQNAKKG